MAAGAAGAAGAGTMAPAPGGGQNPFWVATNLYAEKNNQGAVPATLLTAAAVAGGGAINAGQYLRGLRLILRTTVAGVAIVLTGTGLDLPWNLFAAGAGLPNGGLDLVNVDGSEILYSMGGYAYYLSQKFFRPWLCDPALAYDYFNSATVQSGTIFLQPEIRFGAGVLANTDTRSQYRWDQSLVGAAAAGTQPTVSVTPYMDAWAQPDGEDLQGVPNQPVPPGVNLQTKRRHQIFNLNAIGSDNILQLALTGNAIRGLIMVLRATDNSRTLAEGTVGAGGLAPVVNYDPLYWYLDNRTLGKLNGDIVTQWAQSQYSSFQVAGFGAGTSIRPLGVFPFPRFFNPGDLYGQGWLYTSNATKMILEFNTPAGFTAPGTAEIITDEVYPVGPVDPSLTDI